VISYKKNVAILAVSQCLLLSINILLIAINGILVFCARQASCRPIFAANG
jgi:hypothetical protein